LQLIYREHFRFVWRSLRRLGIGASELEDATQDVFVVFARRLDEFMGTASIKTWLFAIAMRVAQSHRRAGYRHRRRLEAVERARSQPVSGGIERSDAAKVLVGLLEQLPPELRAIYILTELEGMTAVEIAEGLQVKLNTVYSRLRSARVRLRELVAKISPADSRPLDGRDDGLASGQGVAR
jgi:RNA polymerase sigma-70 factor (ECF subfamily)